MRAPPDLALSGVEHILWRVALESGDAVPLRPGDKPAIPALVLLSGGIDSAALIYLAKGRGFNVSALHLSYGQSAARAEQSAATALCDQLEIPLRCVEYQGSSFSAGEIRGRNAFLLQAGLLEFPHDAGLVLIGIHGGTPYPDCGESFLATMQDLFRLQARGRIEIEAPFASLLKADVVCLAADLGVPLQLTHSCEAANEPCGACQSCLDRTRLLEELSTARQ